MYNLRKRARIEKSGEALKGSQEKEDRDDRAIVDRPKEKGFSSLPRHLQEFVLLKTSNKTRLKLFQVNGQLREWVFKEGLFPRDVQRIQTAHRAQRPREKIVTDDGVPIFKILPRSGRADIVKIDAAKAKKSMAFKNIRSCRDLVVGTHGEEWDDDDFRVAEFFPNLRSLGRFYIDEFDEAIFEGTSLEVTLALNFPGYIYHQQGEKLFEWIDKYASRCPSINFADFPFERTVEFLKTRKLRFIEYSMRSVRGGGKIVEALGMILKNGIPGDHPDPCIKIGVGPSLMFHVMSSITKNNTLVIGDLERILKKFKDHRAEVGWRFDNSILGSNAVGFTSRFDESKNLILLLYENDNRQAGLLIKYEPIKK